jgi:phospholipase/lecithinase/hemolysin
MRRLKFVLCFTVAVLLATTAESFAKIYVFGDSLSDTGNFSLVSEGALPPPVYADGRFTNGRVWVEYLAEYLDEEPPMASLSGGTNYAFNGARAAGISPYGSPDLTMQVDLFLLHDTSMVSPHDTFIIWAGSNDIFFGVAQNELSFIQDAQIAIADSIYRLQQAGARKFIILNVPQVGQTPFFIDQPFAAEQLNAVSEIFNDTLAGTLSELQLNEATCLVTVDIESAFNLIQTYPRLFRLSDAVEACTFFDKVETGLAFAIVPDADPTRYLFWDGIHPTTRGHEIVARYSIFEVLKSKYFRKRN